MFFVHLLPCSDGHATPQRKFAIVLHDLCSSLFLLGADRLHPVATGWRVSKALCVLGLFPPFPQKASAASGTAKHDGGNQWLLLISSFVVGIKNVVSNNAWGFLWSAAGLTFTYASSNFRMKRLAVKKFMAHYEPPRPKSKVVRREAMTAIKNRLQNWKQEEHATIVSGRYKSGKTVSVQEALRGARGVWEFTVKVKNWEPAMHQELGVKDSNMFHEVLRRVRAKLQKKKFAKNLTQYPSLLLDMSRDLEGGLCAHVE